jgi:predicted small secreted protein
MLGRLCVGVMVVAMFAIGCNTLKDIGRTINDAASIMCELFALEQGEEALGMSAGEWCNVHDNLKPFIDEALAAQRAAGAMSMGRINATSGGEDPEPPSDGDGKAPESVPDDNPEPAAEAESED